MSVETDSPDPGRGNPDQREAEPSTLPPRVTNGDGAHPPATEAQPAEPSVPMGPPAPLVVDPPRPPDPPSSGAYPPPSGPPLPPLTRGGNGRSEEFSSTTEIGLPPPPAAGAGPAVPFVDLRPGTQRAAEIDAAAGLPATPYTRPGVRRRRQFRRRGAGRRTATPVEGRRVVHRLRQISPWSVFKVVALFYLCVFLMFMVAGVLLWKIGRSTETIDQVEGLVTRLGAYGRCVPEAEVAAGTDFETDDDCPDGEVIVDGFRFEDGTLFRAALFTGVIFVVAGTAITVLLTVLLNLLNDVTGGVRYETVREPSPERASGPSPPSGPGGSGGPGAGNGRQTVPASRSLGR